MPLVNCEISLDLTWSKKHIISSSSDTKLYVSIVTLWSEDNVKLLKQLESGFKRSSNWNKYHSKFKTFPHNRYFNYLINPSFQRVNVFILPFENATDREVHT